MFHTAPHAHYGPDCQILENCPLSTAATAIFIRAAVTHQGASRSGPLTYHRKESELTDPEISAMPPVSLCQVNVAVSQRHVILWSWEVVECTDVEE